MFNERFFVSTLGIAGIFLTIIISCIGLALAVLFIDNYGVFYLLALVDTIGALATSLLISSAMVVYYWINRSTQESNAYQLYRQRQSGIFSVVYNIFAILVSSFLFCLVMGLWKNLGVLAFGPWLISLIAFFGGVWLIDQRKRHHHSKPYR